MVYFIYLPSHLSHITQPLNIGVFRLLKTYFYEEARQYAPFTLSIAIQKQRFLSAYKIASGKALTKENIRAGFRGSGAYPVNLQKLLSKVVHIERPSHVSSHPHTPQNQLSDHESGSERLFNTPQSSRDLQTSLQPIVDTVNHDLRALVSKAGKAFDQKNIIIAELNAENDFLKKKLASLEPKGKKPVQKDPNTVFADYELIEQARDEATRAVMTSTEVDERRLAQDALKIAQTAKDNIFINWQLKKSN